VSEYIAYAFIKDGVGACNPSYLEGKIGRIMVQGQPRQIDLKTPSPK
jgi:hypothetical protein